MDESTMYLLKKMDYLKQVISSAFRASEQAHKILFKNLNSKQNELIAATYINKAISLISTAKAIYMSNIEQLERDEIEDIFHTFDVFESEFLTNLSTDHSHQWTDIEFDKFKEAVQFFIE